MASNREILAKYIAERFTAAISGTDSDEIIQYNPNDRIYVGKLSPQSSTDNISSNVLIKQISVDFRIPKASMDSAKIMIHPQGNFFYRVIPTLEQQRKAYAESFIATFTLQEHRLSSFSDIAMLYEEGALSPEMLSHKVQVLPIYRKIAIEREAVGFPISIANHYDAQNEYGCVSNNSDFKKQVTEQVELLCEEVKSTQDAMPCQFRDKVLITDLLTNQSWERYKAKQITREEFDMFPRFNFDIAVEMKGDGQAIDVTVAFSNETQFGDESAGFGQAAAKTDYYRINTLFNAGLGIVYSNTELEPIEMDYFADDYKYDKRVYALGNNCNVYHDPSKCSIHTTNVPVHIQKRLKTNDALAVKFQDLIDHPVETLSHIYVLMLSEIEAWKDDLSSRQELTETGRRQFSNEIHSFEMEVRRFKTGVDLIAQHNTIRSAFRYMNMAFMSSAKGYNSWRLFQIVFVVSLVLDIVAHEPDLLLDDEVKNKAKTDDIDILYFPTGGGKTEAFLGILVFNLFFDRLRGKEQGMTAFLKYPLRLLSVQQVQRVSNILASAERIRVSEQLGGSNFSLGYFVGEGNTPNKITRELKKEISDMDGSELDDKYRLLDVCPFCGKSTVHVVYDENANSLLHICSEAGCASNGLIPLYMVDDDIYRYIPSVIISTVDKMTAVGLNMRFHNLLFGATYRCPKHGFTSKKKCLVEGCTCTPADFTRVSMKDPAPTLLIQDELHLIKESLGTYDAHYETLVEYFIKELTGCNRGIKVIGATATISAYAEQAKHLYWKNAIRFPAASPYLDHNFYSKIDDNDISRIILGYAPFGKAIVNSVAYSLQYLKRIIADLYEHPEKVLNIDGIQITGSEEEKIASARKLMEDYWIILEYNNVKQESNRVLQALEDPINTELRAEGIQPLVARKMTGDDTFQEVRATLSAIEHASDPVNALDFNMIAATSMISHGVDADRFNLMMFYGIPGNTAEYIQAYSRVGRKHTGIVIDIMRPSREKDRSYLKNFEQFHQFKDILVDSVSINRWATKAVEHTLPGVLSALILNYYEYTLQHSYEDISKYGDLKLAISDGQITAEMLKQHAYKVYKCSASDSAIGKLYKVTIDRMIDDLVDTLKSGSFESKTYLTEVFGRCYYHVMSSLRDTDKQIIVEMR